MSQQLLTESQEKTTQRIARRVLSPASAQSFQCNSQPIPQLQRTLGNRNVAQLIQAMRLTPEGNIIGLQRKLTVGAADDQYEQEADRVARQVVNTPDAVASNSMQRAMSPEEDKDKMLQTKPLAASITPFVQRQMANTEEPEDKDKPVQAKFLNKTSREHLQRQPETDEEEEPIQAKSAESMSESFEAGGDVETQLNRSKGGGSPLPDPVRSYMEPRFGVDFSQVRVHSGSDAIQMNRDVGAQAFTHGSDIYFGAGHSPTNLELTAHELTHIVQQTGGTPLQTKRNEEVAPFGTDPSIQRICDACALEDRKKKGADPFSPNVSGALQRTIGDGHDLDSPRFSLLEDLEAAYDNETIIRKGRTGRGVQAIQQSLYDLGFTLPEFGADGDFGEETKAAVKAFQKANPPLVDDGEVGPLTMETLNARFAAPVLPSSAVRSAPWTVACVRSILCPWSPHTIDVLKSRITLKSFDSISWADVMWDGAAWVPAPFPGGGYNTGTEIGVLNSSCEEMSETLYHEVLHAEQPTSHGTTLKKESYAYRIGEEFSIALGLGGRPNLRSTDAQGREFADPTKVGAFVASEYPSVPAGGGGDEVIDKAATLGHVQVRRPNGTIYTRPAAIGEKVPGPMTTAGEVTHPNAGWICP